MLVSRAGGRYPNALCGAYHKSACDGAFTITHGEPVESDPKYASRCLTAKTLEFSDGWGEPEKYEFVQEMGRGRCRTRGTKLRPIR
ncbi:MAG: hypothetical protein EBT20_12115 [Alphaproteobacteria bacterium]|nr:hypothetical protein [Alphaproteobacteria bacterium]